MPASPSALFHTIGVLVSGDLEKPLLDATAVYVADGLIQAIGPEAEALGAQADLHIDVRGATLTPGLWDSHFHPYFGEYTPRIETFNTISRTVRAGTTSLVSAGPAHQPGIYLPSAQLPNVQAASQGGGAPTGRDAAATRALAIVTAQSWQRERPMGVKCWAGVVIAEPGLVESDFAAMAAAGVQRIKFLRPVPSVAESRRYVEWAHTHGMLVMAHTGGRALIQETASIRETMQVLRPDIASHVNGGPTPPALEDVDWLLDETTCALDLVFHGNMRVARHILEKMAARGELHRVMIGTDSPSSGGFNPHGVMRTITLLNNISDFPPEVLLCLATGNAARNYRLPGGRVAVGEPADLVVWDPIGGSVTTSLLECIQYGDMPMPGLVMIDGQIRAQGDPRQIDSKRVPFVTDTRAARAEAAA